MPGRSFFGDRPCEQDNVDHSSTHPRKEYLAELLRRYVRRSGLNRAQQRNPSRTLSYLVPTHASYTPAKAHRVAAPWFPLKDRIDDYSPHSSVIFRLELPEPFTSRAVSCPDSSATSRPNSTLAFRGFTFCKVEFGLEVRSEEHTSELQ